jgi:hypothetical protein
MDLFDVLDILETGYDCARSRRKRGTFERCKKSSGKTRKVVAVESIQKWNDTLVWLIIHVGVMK